MKAIVKVGYRCNQRCPFCHRLELREQGGGAESSDREVRARIERARALGHSMVVLSGGEPTIRRELTGWASYIASLGMDVGLITNGQMLAYPKLVEALLAHRLRYVYMSLHGGRAEIHDRLAGAPGFENVCNALANLHRRGLELMVNTVVTRYNVDHLDEVVELMRAYPDAVLKFSLVEPRGGGERLFDELTPTVSAAGAAVTRAFAVDPARADRCRFAHDAIPLCLLPGWEHLYADLETAGFATMIEVGDRDFFACDDRTRVWPERCRDCRWRGLCPGLYRGYLDRRGDQELAPVSDGPRASSFHFVRTAWATTPAAGARCPLMLSGVTPWSRGRDLMVRQHGIITRYRTATRDLASDELEAIKHQFGQVYLDQSARGAGSDSASAPTRLVRADCCERCRANDRCTGVYDPSTDHPSDRDREALAALLAGMTGAILVVGGDEARYLDGLPTQAEEETSYVGIVSDPRRLTELRRRWPQAELHAMAAEEMARLDRPFAHIVLLRSWNRLADVEPVLAAVATLLSPGGTFTLVDEAGFALARTPAQAARGRPAAVDHYRNDDGATAERRIAASPTGLAAELELVERRDVTPATGTQWLLHFRRRGCT